MRNQSSRTARFIRSFAFGIDPCTESVVRWNSVKDAPGSRKG